MRRRAAVEPVIGHIKTEHRMGRNYLKGRSGDRINAVLATAAGLDADAACSPSASPKPLKNASHRFFTDDELKGRRQAAGPAWDETRGYRWAPRS